MMPGLVKRVEFVALVTVLVLLLTACGSPGDDNDAAGDVLATGKVAFESRCAGCHGFDAVGTDTGPPLVHQVYEPGHHPDWAIRNAIADGVRSHHWNFGDMPAVEGVEEDEVTAIICYVRDLQRQADIHSEPAC